HLLAVHCRDESRAQSDFRLAEADVAANQPVHWPAFLQILERCLDGSELVLRLFIGEAGAEFVIEPVGRGHDFARLEFARRRGLAQVLADPAAALFELSLLPLPGPTAETVQLGALFIGAIARQKLDILDRQEQPVIAGIHDEEAIMRRALHLDGPEALEAAK